MIELKMAHRDERQIDVSCRMEGGTDPLLDELAAGMAHAIIRIADDLPVVDDIHESLARVMGSRMIDMVVSEIELRDTAGSRCGAGPHPHPAAAGDLIRQPCGLPPSPEGKVQFAATDKPAEA